MHRHVVALVINWNGSHDTLELLSSLAEQTDKDHSIEVVIVDNCSLPEDLLRLEKGIEALNPHIPVKLIVNQINIGVPAAYNQAISAAGNNHSFYLRLDNDVVFLEGGVKRLCDALIQNRSRGIRIVGANVRYFDDVNANNGGAVFFDLVRGRNKITYPGMDTLCDGVLGCVMLVDGDVVRALSPEVFMSWLFITSDESELSMHCRELGWATYYIAEPAALHKGGRSTGKAAVSSSLYSLRNWSYLALRYVRPRFLVPFILTRLLFTGLYKLLRGEASASYSIMKGIKAFLARSNVASRELSIKSAPD